MAKRITPNIFRITLSPFLPKIRSIRLEDFRTKYTKITFIIMATIIFSTWYSALNESKVVTVPAPAIKGKAMGTMEALSG